MVVDKKNLVFPRTEKGELIPKLIEVDGVGEFELVPLTRGQLLEFYEKAQSASSPGRLTEDIILIGCRNPQLTKDEINDLGFTRAEKISQRILELSGVENASGSRKP